jgi:hypothetical protein
MLYLFLLHLFEVRFELLDKLFSLFSEAPLISCILKDNNEFLFFKILFVLNRTSNHSF